MYKIGEFSKIVSMSVKTLRYYHEIGLLVPSDVDAESGYRYYSEASYNKAMLIRTFKDFDFTINEILEIIDRVEDASDVSAYLQEKNEQLNLRKKEIERLQEKIINTIKNNEVIKMSEMHEIVRKAIGNQKIASIRYKGKYTDMGKYIGELFKCVGGKAAGAPFALYHDESYMDEDADIEVCVCVKEDVNKHEVKTRQLEGGEFISVLHVGPYDTLHESYKRLTDHINENKLETVLPSREMYIKGPGMILKGNPQKYETELMIQLK